MYALLFLLVLPMLYSPAFGQYELNKEVSSKIVLANGFIITKPGAVPIFGSILIENGMIKTVASNLKAPPDARVVQLDSMYVYAGFILGPGQYGLEEPEREREEIEDPGNPTDEQAGIMPGTHPLDQWSGEDLDDPRKSGVTAMAVVPYGNMLPGKAALIMPGKYEDPKAYFYKDLGLAAQFEGSGRMYPATYMGITAKFRDLFRKVSYKIENEKKYAANPNGMERPTMTATEEALVPLVTGSTPVYFKTESLLDIYRAQALKNDLGFEIIYTEVSEGWELQGSNKVFFSLDLPEIPKEDKEVENEELLALLARNKEAADKFYRQIVTFSQTKNASFSALEGDVDDLLPLLHTLVSEYNLSRNAALEMITTTPAGIMGVSNVMGTLENGKLANITVLSDTLGNKDAAVRFSVVEGQVFEFEVKKRKKSSATSDVDLAGTWTYTVEIPGQSQTGSIEITGEPGNYEAELTSDSAPETLKADEVELDGNTLTISYTQSAQGQSILITIEVEIEGDEFEGTASAGQFGSFPIEGSKKPKF